MHGWLERLVEYFLPDTVDGPNDALPPFRFSSSSHHPLAPLRPQSFSNHSRRPYQPSPHLPAPLRSQSFSHHSPHPFQPSHIPPPQTYDHRGSLAPYEPRADSPPSWER